MGNCPSGKASPNLGPKRNTVQAVWCEAARTLGSWLGGSVPALTAVSVLGSKPERARDDWSARYTERSWRRKYSFQPMRPSGVVSQVLLLRQHPCTITTGTCWSPFTGIWYCTYIWLTVISPVTGGAFGPNPGCVTGLDSPPTKKLPC